MGGSSSENSLVKVVRVRGRGKFGKEFNNIVLKLYNRGLPVKNKYEFIMFKNIVKSQKKTLSLLFEDYTSQI